MIILYEESRTEMYRKIRNLEIDDNKSLFDKPGDLYLALFIRYKCFVLLVASSPDVPDSSCYIRIYDVTCI